MDINMIGPGIVLSMGCIGSAVGCGIAGMASHGIMARVEEGYAKYIIFSAVPSTQAILGFVLTLLMKTNILSGVLSPVSGIFIGLFVGLALLFSAMYQGKCAATAIQATAKNPSLFGKSFVAIAILESFALFAFVFSLLIIK